MTAVSDHREVLTLVVNQLDRIEKKVDLIDARLDDHEKIQIKQEANLREHMKRSDYLEKHHEILKGSVDPVVSAYTVAWGICKIVLGLSILFGVFEFIRDLQK